MQKVIHRIPTVQFGYIEVEGLSDTPSKIKEEHEILLNLFQQKTENKADDKFLTDYIYNAINGLGNTPESWEALSPQQQQTLKCYRNATNRKPPQKYLNTKS